WNISKKTRRFVHRQIEHIGDVLSFVSNLQRLTIVASPVTHFALDINVGQKMHLDLNQSAAFAILAATAFDVKTETSGIIATHSGGGKLREQLPNGGERAAVSDRISSRGAPNRTLVNDEGLDRKTR